MPTSAELERTPRVLSAQFGDGYSQDSPDGLNSNLQKWSLEFNGVLAETGMAIDDFLSARRGVERFYFINLRAETIVCKCKTWKVKDVGGRKVNVTATFEEVAG
ncbi:phage tail protein [Methylovulum psychrotolerans]|nr:phage tail protein [Methylovulum psychrotolerans]